MYLFLYTLFFSLSTNYPHILWLFSFVFLIPLLFLLWKTTALSKTIILKIFLILFLSGLFSVLYFLSAYPLLWLNITDPFIAWGIIFFIWFLFSISFSIPTLLWFLSIYFLKKRYRLNFFNFSILSALIWVLSEYVRTFLFSLVLYGNESVFGTDYTYYSLGYLAPSIPILKNLLMYGGIYFVSFFLILINHLLFWLIFQRDKIQKISALFFSLLVFVVFILSYYGKILQDKENHKVSNISVYITNTSIPSSLNPSKEKAELALEIEKKISSESDSKKESLLVLPENFNFFSKNSDSLPSLSVIGSASAKNGFNFYFFKQETQKIFYSQKMILMPVAEYELLSIKLLRQIIPSLNTINESKKLTQKRGSNAGVFEFNQGLYFGGTICSENISPHIYREAVNQGANFFVHTGSHAPFRGSKILAYQSLPINRTRALEYGRFFISSVNYGDSMVISDRGEILSYIKNDQTEKYQIKNILIAPHSYTTFYSLHGDWIVVLSTFYLIIFFLFKRRNT